MVASRSPAEPAPRRRSPIRREMYRELCRDDFGNRYTVVVWRELPGSATSYTLEDGTPVHYEDECVFALPGGRMISRCED
jgi:hypothetical protein